MKTRSIALAVFAALLLNVGGLAIADTHRSGARNAQALRLVSLLPASDAVAVFDAKRSLSEALPSLLSANQPVLTHIMDHINKVESHTGIDLRKFDQVVVGASMKSGKETKDLDCDLVAIASGDININAMIGIAKLASKGKFREEKIGQTTVYTFSLKDSVKSQASKVVNTTNPTVMHPINAMKALDAEIAVAALDRNTLALGCPAKVRETIEARSHVGSDLTDLLFTRETAIMSFAVRTPAGMSKFVPLDNDDLGATINSIRYASGSVDVAPTGTSLQMLARTTKPEQALQLKDTLEALQLLGKGILGSSKQTNQQVYGRMLKNVKFGVSNNDVTLDLLVPQADIDILVAGIK